MEPSKRTARIAGYLYLICAFTGPFTLFYVPSRLIVAGDASATIANILANESLFRSYIAIGIASELIFISVILLLFRLLKHINMSLAVAMVLLILFAAPLSFMGSATQVATLALAKNSELLAAFSVPQREALIIMLFQAEKLGVLVSMVFWGAWLLPLGVLIYRSGFLPRLLGIWIFINGISYLLMSLAGILAPQYAGDVRTVVFPVLFGELALTLWLAFGPIRIDADGVGTVRRV